MTDKQNGKVRRNIIIEEEHDEHVREHIDNLSQFVRDCIKEHQNYVEENPQFTLRD